ncbi:DUF6283 family protein [Cupriavidus sp. TMH.W2]|uniref:DUF6283 family protein n=1 Tax=Cupriavidus sp. TMH.W2 TaxID=3434465 RepID=UPI003D774147
MTASDSQGPRSRRAKVVRVRPAGDDHQVVTTHGGPGVYRREPCDDCPWRKDAVNVFPAEAFRHSASTAYDAAQETFACHQSGKEKPALCAGFLLRGAEHNLSVRIRLMTGDIADDVHDGGHALHDDYRAMAIANGVPPDDPAIAPCRESSYSERDADPDGDCEEEEGER